MAIVKRNEAAESIKRVPERNNRCAAHGCPNAGAICNTTHANESTEWLCRFHFGKRMREWPSITEAILRGDFSSDGDHSAMRADVVSRVAGRGPLKWPNEVLALHAAGLYPSHYGLQLARGVLNESKDKK